MTQYRPGPQQRGDRPQADDLPASLPANVLDAIIVRGDAEQTVEWAEKIGQRLGQERLQTTQIRRFFSAVREIEMDWPPDAPAGDPRAKRAQRQLLLLVPKLAYQERRGEQGGGVNAGVRRLKNTLEPAIRAVGDNRERFGYFVEFFEAILAYHRFHGGRN